MSIAPIMQDRGASPLMSNNPFRNKVAASQAPVQPTRPISTNPFLDQNEFQKEPAAPAKPLSFDNTNGATELFASMTVNGHQPSPERVPRPTTSGTGMPGRPENVPPPPRMMRGPPPNQRISPSEEERRRQGAMLRRGTEMDIFADPPNASQSRERRSLRRNSESSVRDKPSGIDSEEEKRRRERRAKDPRTGKHKPSKKLDIIDKLDVTSIYGTGLFHHDGPFDACNPNRNRKKHRYAPMQAFPKDSANMQIGGAGPVKPQMDYDKYHGRTQEAHIDYNEAAVVDEDAEYMRRPQVERSTSFNPTAFDTVHGKETAGLGTSTFLEGAPASRIAMQRRESEMMNEVQQVNGTSAGLSRKKSIVQKIRGVRTNRVQSPDSDRGPASPLPTGRSDNAANPFFKEYDRDYERKGQQIAQAEEQALSGRARALSSPKMASAPLERQITSDNVEPPQESKPTGFLGRMKSLKKTKTRPERREAS